MHPYGHHGPTLHTKVNNNNLTTHTIKTLYQPSPPIQSMSNLSIYTINLPFQYALSTHPILHTKVNNNNHNLTHPFNQSTLSIRPLHPPYLTHEGKQQQPLHPYNQSQKLNPHNRNTISTFTINTPYQPYSTLSPPYQPALPLPQPYPNPNPNPNPTLFSSYRDDGTDSKVAPAVVKLCSDYLTLL